MKVANEGYLNRKVILTEDIGKPTDLCFLVKGSTGVCTADLEQYNVFAVWFDEPVGTNENGKPIYWVRFEPWSEREKFEILP